MTRVINFVVCAPLLIGLAACNSPTDPRANPPATTAVNQPFTTTNTTIATSTQTTQSALPATDPPTTTVLADTPSTTAISPFIERGTPLSSPEPTIRTAPPPTGQPLTGQTPTLTNVPTQDAVQVATSFIGASIDANAPTLRALTDPSYVETAVLLWIGEGQPTGQQIIAAKQISNAAGRARVAV